jgi:hypothetical protein
MRLLKYGDCFSRLLFAIVADRFLSGGSSGGGCWLGLCRFSKILQKTAMGHGVLPGMVVRAEVNKLTEITTRPCEDKIVKTVTKTTNTEENSLTIVISNQKIKEAEDNVVNLIDESQEEIDPKPSK